MKRNIVLDKSIDESEVLNATNLALYYMSRIKTGIINPLVLHGYSLSYSDKNIFVRKIKEK